MAYSSMQGSPQNTLAATLEVHKWNAQNVRFRLVNSHIIYYQVFPWATGPLTLLESITKVPDRQLTEMGKLSTFFFFLSSFYCDNTIMAETISTQKTGRQLSLSKHTPPETERVFR